MSRAPARGRLTVVVSPDPGSPNKARAPLASDLMSTVAPSRRLDLTLLQERSSGTFAKVYLAQATGSGGISRLVAVKVLREKWAQADEFVARTKDEARMLAQLRHPGIVRVEDLVELNGQLAIVMEFVDGIDLQQLMEAHKKRGERLPPRVAYEATLRAAAALDAAFRKAPFGRAEPLNVVHRDIKPSNIMLTPEGELKVLDFGTARGNFENRSAQTGMFRFGSLKYMSPERRLGDRGEHSGDMYALGLSLIEMLHGGNLPLLPEPPEHAQVLAEIVAGLENTGMPAADWDEALRRVLLQMCADDPDMRPPADQLVKLMRAFADNADGPSFEAFCSDVVAAIAEEVYPKTGGSLTGMHLTIDPGGDRVESYQEPAAPPSPVAPPADAGRRRPSTAPDEQLAGPTVSERQVAWSPEPPAQPAPEEAPAGGGSKKILMIVAALVAFLMVGGAVVVFGVYAFLSKRGDVEAPPPVVAVEEAPPTPTGTPLTVDVEGEAVQWVRLLDDAGAVVMKGEGAKLEGTPPAGRYKLAVKLVGRGSVESPLELADVAKTLHCTQEKGGKVRCVNTADSAEVHELQ